MQSGFQAKTPSMQEASQHVHQVADGISGQVNQLINQLDPLVGSWYGAAASSFAQVKEQWLDDVRRLHSDLYDIGDRLKDSHTNYQTLDLGAAERFKKRLTELR